MIDRSSNLIHSPDKLVNVFFTVTSITSFHVVIPFLLQSTKRCLEFEGPKEIVSFLEMRSNNHDLMNKIFNTDDPMFAKNLAKG